jgi:hypothetical protein
MAEIVNLRRARKAKERVEKDKTAQANRVAHGTPKALRNLAEARKDKADQALTGHKLENEKDDNRSVGESQSDQK